MTTDPIICRHVGRSTWQGPASAAPRKEDRMTRLTVQVSVGDGAVMDIINPQSFEDGGPEWRMRYGDPLSIRYEVATLLSSYDALLSDDINMTEATRRLRLMRARRLQLCERAGE